WEASRGVFGEFDSPALPPLPLRARRDGAGASRAGLRQPAADRRCPMGDRTPRSLDALVNYQVQRWAAASSAPTRGESGPEHRPVITVSREYGTQGSALARLVAERFGFRVWDQELVHAIAEDAGAS